MKKSVKKMFVCVASVLALCLLFGGCAMFDTGSNDDYLRIHIRANSNNEVDQSVKYKVKNAVVDFLTPHLASAQDKVQAKQLVISKKADLEKVANDVLTANGFSYQSKSEVKKEMFPTRSYDGFTLESGEYEAVIVSLGSGGGDNWWCVVYPPLCFVGGEGTSGNTIKYKSKLLEIIENFFR